MNSDFKLALTFDDLQIVPKYSEIESRALCQTKTKITKKKSIDIPITAAPMDTVCGLSMINQLGKLGGIGFLHRFCSIEDQGNMVGECDTNWCGAAVGVTGDWWERTEHLIEKGCDIILLDVAHGHHINVKNAIHKIKSKYPIIEVIAGNVCTRSGARDLCEWGVDGIRCNVGNGCFTPYMKVKTNSGLKNIKDIKVGDIVFSHTGEKNEVLFTHNFDRDEEIIEINGIECTKNHEFYVINKKDCEKIQTDDDIKKYSKWIEAEYLTDEWLLVELND